MPYPVFVPGGALEVDEQIGAFVRVVVPLAFISSTAEKTISIGAPTEVRPPMHICTRS